MNGKKYTALLVAVLIGILLFLHRGHFNLELRGTHVWRQSITALHIRNFLRYDNNILNPRVASFNGGRDNISRYEFPLMQWVIAQVERVTGESVAVVKFYQFLIAISFLIGFMFLLKRAGFDRKYYWMGIWAVAFSPVIYYYSVSPIPDMLALSFATWALYHAVGFYRSTQNKLSSIFYIGLLISLATLVKLPYILFMIPAVYLIFAKYRMQWKNYLLPFAILASCMIPAFSWYAWVIPQWTVGITKGVFDNQISMDHALQIIFYHLKVMFPYRLLNIVFVPFFLLSVIPVFRSIRKDALLQSMILGFLAYLAYFLFELNMIDVVHDYYMMPFVPFLFYGVLTGIRYCWQLSYPAARVLVGAVLIAAPFTCRVNTQDDWDITDFKDIYEKQAEFIGVAPQDEKVIMLKDFSGFILPYLIDHRGYIFNFDTLPRSWVKNMISEYNVHYMYSNSRMSDSINRDFIRDTVFKHGEFKVFRLKDKEAADTIPVE